MMVASIGKVSAGLLTFSYKCHCFVQLCIGDEVQYHVNKQMSDMEPPCCTKLTIDYFQRNICTQNAVQKITGLGDCCMPDEYYLHYVALMRLLSHVSQYLVIHQTVLHL